MPVYSGEMNTGERASKYLATPDVTHRPALSRPSPGHNADGLRIARLLGLLQIPTVNLRNHPFPHSYFLPFIPLFFSPPE